ncbi:MAG: sensor histidine kinase [Protaetiibacter sp.]
MPGPSTHPAGPPWSHDAWGGGPWALRDPDARPRPSRALRLWVPVIVSALVQLTGVAWILRIAQPDPATAALAVALAAIGPLALIGARRFPGPVAAIVAAATLASLLLSPSGGPVPISLAFALAAAVVRGAPLWAWISLGVAWALALVVLALGAPVDWPLPRVVGTTFALVIAVGLGELIRTRRERIRAFRAAAARRRQSAAEEERLRIARELHDVLAHSLSQINVQAGVGLHLADTQPEKAAEALAAIKQVSKTALDDVRTVLGVLREGEADAPLAPQPTLASIATLVAATRIPGAEVELESGVGDAEVPAPVAAAAYRIVQEALTNVARHGVEVTRVRVRLAPSPGGIRIEVRDDGRAASVTPGRGLLGMRERVEQLGGVFATASEGGFLVTAELPTGRRSA